MSKSPTVLRMESIFKQVGYHPHPAQWQFHRSEARNRVVAGGRRIGKSEMGAGELDIEAVRTRFMLPYLEERRIRREFWIVGPNYTDSEKEFRKHYDALKSVDAPFDKPGTYYDAHSGDMQISMYKGKYLVLGKSAAHPERLVGEGVSGVIMAEAAKQKERTWTKYIRPTLADYQGWSIHSSTPEGKNWFYDLFKRGKDPADKSWESWRFGSWRNPFVYPLGASPQGLQMLREAIDDPKAVVTERLKRASKVDPEIIELMMDLTEETFNQEVAADFTEFAGRVFKRFDEDVHVGDYDYQPGWKTYAAVDYGFTDPFVWLLLQENPHDGTVIVLDEVYQTGLTIDDAARLVVARGLNPGSLVEFFPDPSRPDDTLALERHLQVKANSDTGGERRVRIRYIAEALREINRHLSDEDPLRHPRLLFDRKCKNTIDDMAAYRYPDKRPDAQRRVKDEPLHTNSHGPEALGRYYRGRYGDPGAATESGGTRIARSNLSR